jgi:UDP-N-acetylglucosamine--N-acetylmuramyl-(pentapeptide) pyrophosphoryl-undecaprenol N-acetylglucosamine transferase
MHKAKKIKLVLTGGHAATTALSVIEEIIRRGSLNNWEIYWIGAASAIEGKKIPTLESNIFPKIGVITYPIVAGKLQRKFTLWTIPTALKIPVGFFHALILLLRIKPDIILSFGGFAALPVVIVGSFLKIPVSIHEQTVGLGLANKLSSPFARKVLLARNGIQGGLSGKKTEVVGNPIMTQIAEIEPKDTLGDPPYIFITGGSRGSQTINRLVEKIIPKLILRFNLIHHTGYLDYEKFLKVRMRLPAGFRKRYEA